MVKGKRNPCKPAKKCVRDAAPELLECLKEACDVLTEYEIAASQHNIQHMLDVIAKAEGNHKQ